MQRQGGAMPQHTSASPMPRLAYSVKEAAHLAGLSERSLRYLMTTGRLGFVRLGKRRVLIRHVDLEALLKRNYVKPIAPLDADGPIRTDVVERKR
jgi:excisionase family DNA binding protein